MKANKYRDHYCGNLSEDNINENVVVSGWVDSVRDHGGILFLDLRDSEGVLQVTSHDNSMFENLKENLIRELMELQHSGRMSASDIEMIKSLTTSLKNIYKIDKCVEERESYRRGRMYRDDGMYRDDRMYDDGMSRRYMRGYRARGGVAEQLHELMENADEDEKQILKKALKQIEG